MERLRLFRLVAVRSIRGELSRRTRFAMFMLRVSAPPRARALAARRLSVLSSLFSRGAATPKGTTHTVRSHDTAADPRHDQTRTETQAQTQSQTQTAVPLCAIDTLQPYDLRLSLFFEPQPPLRAPAQAPRDSADDAAVPIFDAAFVDEERLMPRAQTAAHLGACIDILLSSLSEVRRPTQFEVNWGPSKTGRGGGGAKHYQARCVGPEGPLTARAPGAGNGVSVARLYKR